MTTTDLLSLIGNTPLVELRRMSPKPGVRLFAKLEGGNPSGSVKDRVVRAIVEAAERRGDLTEGMTLVDASSGNTAIALAMVGKQKGYPVEVVLPEGVPQTIVDLLHLLDAEIHWREPQAGMQGAILLAQELGRRSDYYCLGQFTDAVNVEAHYVGTGAEVLEAVPEVDVFVAGIGTGGTIMGAGRRLREANPDVRVVGVEPRLGERLQGLRNMEEGFRSPLLDLAQLDGRFLVDSATAFQAAHAVARAEGIIAGVSSGATLHAALRVAEGMERGNIVVMFSDGGWKYLPLRPWGAAHQEQEALDEVHWW